MTGKDFYNLTGECPVDMGRDLGEVECTCPRHGVERIDSLYICSKCGADILKVGWGDEEKELCTSCYSGYCAYICDMNKND